MKELKNKVAVVTGAASGIGRGMAEAFVAAGMKVVLSDIDPRALEETTKSLRAAGAAVHSVVTDVAKSDEVDALARETLGRFGAVHVLCNNAGIFIGGEASWTKPLADWQWILNVNVMGVVHGVRSFLPLMIEQKGEAHIVNTASLGGLLAAGSTLYGTTKYAVVGLSENLHAELQRGKFPIRVSVLCPGLVDTNIFLTSRKNQPGGPQLPPAALRDAAARELEAIRERAAGALKEGLDPRAVGEQVVAGIRGERIYILTNPEFNKHIEQRTRDLLRG